MARGASIVPKYTIRLALIWLIPLASWALSGFSLVPSLLATALTPVELPKVRQRLFGAKLKKQIFFLRAPALLRLAVLWVLQVWWLLLWRATGPDAGAAAPDADGIGAEASTELLGSLSVVLPCASEGEFALKTVRSVFESTPSALLREIIVVDDGSEPPLEQSHLTAALRSEYRVRLIRHETTVGLIGAKKAGGDAAAGDIVVFFDCHVAPQPGWHNSFVRLIADNYRRIVVPVITDLDVGTWQQRRSNGGNAKCYLTWDADFKWFQSDDPYVPVLSGGLLGISKRWWNETGGYDEHMRGWGGENLDQSLRSWLCGGEIMVARDSFVAHMWRVGSDPRTHAKYHLPPHAATANRLRAAVAWFGDFAAKLEQFPAMESKKLGPDGNPWYGSISNILEVKSRLQCRSFAWFMRRFKNVYEDGGLLPSETFGLRDPASGQCLTYLGTAGTSGNGRGKAALRACEVGNDRQRWHGANRDLSAAGQPCCSGVRAWNTDQCLAAQVSGGAAETFVCDISGRAVSQHWKLSAGGQLKRTENGFLGGESCLQPQPGGSSLEVAACSSPWAKDRPEEPVEWRLYRHAVDTGQA